MRARRIGGRGGLCFTSTGGGKEEMGHIKGSLGHGGWYLTQIHIFHSDGRGTMEEERQGESRACIYVCVCTWGWSACS